MSNEAFKTAAVIRRCYERQLATSISNFKVADANLLELVPDISEKSTVAVRREIWKEVKQARGSTETAPEKPLAGGEVVSPDEKRKRLSGSRFVLTAAQNNTYLHDDFWAGLLRYCDIHDAKLLVSRFSYNKNAWRRASNLHELDEKDENKAQNTTDLWYDPRILPYVCDEQVKLADDLVFCGELDILPTAANPLRGLENFTGPNSGIVPHAKVAMKSQATMRNEPAKLMFSTGTVTKRNYIDRRAGQLATFHHTFAALLIEVDEDGQWFPRQLVADDNGVFYDLDRAYGPNWDAPASEFGETVATLGDIHVEQMDTQAVNTAIRMCWGTGVSRVVIHDLLDKQPRNHHSIDDPHYLALMQAQKHRGSVEAGVQMAANFLDALHTALPDVKRTVIRSNHDQALEVWLKNSTAFKDPINSAYWCELNSVWLHYLSQGDTSFDIFRHAIFRAAGQVNAIEAVQNTYFPTEDTSCVYNGIEHGMHGHRGPNGARGTPSSFRQMGAKLNTAHTHSPGIIDGVWTAGTLSKLDMGYNKGPSSWVHANILTYPSGKRTVMIQRGSKWRA